MSGQATRDVYRGAKPALVISIDLGTTFSGASYTFLIPGEVARVYCVTGFRGQEDQPLSTKVPTVLYYDNTSQLVACGSQPIDDLPFEEEDLLKVEWFKLLLRPASWDISLSKAPKIVLPDGLTVVDVLGHFLRYMKNCIRGYIEQTHVDGLDLWNSTIEEAVFILTHPNGWEGFQQGQMRDAAISGGLVPDSLDGRARIEVITEGEAAFHWCVDNGIAASAMTVGSHVVLADCGGGTIDVSSFKVASVNPLQLQEVDPAQCRVAGSIFVTQAFRKLMEEKFEGTQWAEGDYIDRLVEEFDKKTKCLFRDNFVTTYIRIGSHKDNDAAKGIKLGKLAVTGHELSSVFERSCAETADAIKHQVKGKRNCLWNKTVFLVGGFAASPWLFEEVKRRLNPHLPSSQFKRAESQTAKAVAHGAIAHFLDSYVVSRIARHTYGTDISYFFDESNSSHEARRSLSYVDSISGQRMLRGGFKKLLQKGEVVESDACYRTSMEKDSITKQDVLTSVTVYRYTGTIEDIEFLDGDAECNFQSICTFTATVPISALQNRSGKYGQYWAAPFDVVIELGKTELQCFVEWKEDGVISRSLATSVWERT